MKDRFVMGGILGTLLGLTVVGCLQLHSLNDYEAAKAANQLFGKLIPISLPEVSIYSEDPADAAVIKVNEEATYFGMTEDELNLVYAVVMQEGGPTYESAEYVMSTIVNRVNNPDKWSWAGETIIDQITYPQQYCYSLDDYWVKYLNGNVPDTVKNAVKSIIEFGPVHDYDCFRGYYLEDCEQVADNWYFIG